MDHWPINPKRLAIFIGILVLILMVMDFNARIETLNLLRREQAVVSAQATQAMETQAALQTQVAYASSDRVVDDWARTEGHYIQSGDQPVVPVGIPGDAPTVLESPTPSPTAMANWQVWWELFFGP